MDAMDLGARCGVLRPTELMPRPELLSPASTRSCSDRSLRSARSASADSFDFAPYDFKLWNLIIRPPRVVYDDSELGPTEFFAGGVRATRRDLKLRTRRALSLSCSYFTPSQGGREIQRFPVIIYLHGNSSSRLEACNLVGALISQHMSLFCFDAAGCGQSEGEYVSLGWHESDDLAAVIDCLRSFPNCGPIGLWGRSMGAATALMHADQNPNLGALCLDSSFANLRQLLEELAQSKSVPLPVPSWLVGPALALIRLRVKSLADFDIEDLVPLQHAKRSCAPAIFLHGREDDFVHPGHSQQLYEAYMGSKELMAVEGDHNSERSGRVVSHIIGFFGRCLRRLPLEPIPRPVLVWDPQFVAPSLDGVPLRVPHRLRQSTDLAKKDKVVIGSAARRADGPSLIPVRGKLVNREVIERPCGSMGRARVLGAVGGA
ncbi:unnamed protein product [Effrenium voratum]|uniref:Serine aminopeptidase S33 domain-containing protein n=1 Tax=Effrenium voratum TaxID=2562239 RepID=A0AA36JJC4_9DINO|nr:unnamed protein product [Effrenium voratum]CAJ1434831.1 unnamed protein product [Effrenium voratum]